MFAVSLPSEVPDHVAAIRPPVALERGEGAARIRVRRRGERTVLADLYQRSPCRVMFPDRADDEPLEAVMVTTSGGLAGGDRIELDIAADRGSHSLITTQAAEKIYRSLGAETAVSTNLAVAEGATLEYLPQETILFEGARLARRNSAEVAGSGRLIAAEMVVFGRLARGERFSRGLWHEAWRIRREGRLIWADTIRLEHDIAETIEASSGFAGAEAMASALYVAGDAERLQSAAQSLLEEAPCRAALSRLGETLVIRWLGAAALLRTEFSRFLKRFRSEAGIPGKLPRLWYS